MLLCRRGAAGGGDKLPTDWIFHGTTSDHERRTYDGPQLPQRMGLDMSIRALAYNLDKLVD
jgi:hypothetical protein